MTLSQTSVLISQIGGCALSSVMPALATRILGGPKVLFADSKAPDMDDSEVRSPFTQLSLRFSSGVVARAARLIARQSSAVTRQPWPAARRSEAAIVWESSVYTLLTHSRILAQLPPQSHLHHHSVVFQLNLCCGWSVASNLQHQSQRRGDLQGREKRSLPEVLSTFQCTWLERYSNSLQMHYDGSQRSLMSSR